MAVEMRKVLDNIHPVTDEAWAALERLCEDCTAERGAYLLRAGDRAHFCYFLLDGVVRVYYSRDGNEYNKTFFTAGMFPTPITALLTGQPADISFQALTNCSLISFPYRQFRDLFTAHISLMALMLAIMELQWIKKEQHDIRMVTNDATTNYLIFRETYPDLESQIPQYHISSYLGITPIQLSRIRAALRTKKISS